MTVVLRLLGASLVGVAALLFAGSFATFVRRRATDYTATLEFLSLMRREISCRLATPRELASRAGSGRLAEVGFFTLIEQGESLGAAFLAVSDKLFLDGRDAELIRDYFESFGGADAADELRALDAVTEEFSSRQTEVREGAPIQIRLALTLSVLFALGALILLL